MSARRWTGAPRLLALLLIGLGPAAAAAGQAPGGRPDADLRAAPTPQETGGGGWNAPRALAVARAAAEARRAAGRDAVLRSYRARAEGHVYFLGEFAGERQLVRADQIALRIDWRHPGRSSQTIVGRRSEMRLPTRIRYHIDHLSVVVDNLDDRIRLGEGDEVRRVLHPAAPGALSFYDFRIAGSRQIRTADRTVRVDALEVRPSRPDAPGVVGTLFVDRASGGIARMAVTFTAAAYMDSDLDYIQLDLRSGLWEGRHWLPSEQEVEIRRQVPWLSYPVGGVIRTRFRVFDYELNAGVPALPPGDGVAALPPESLAAYGAWRAPLHGGPLAGAERDERTLEELRRRARDLVRRSALPGTSRWQLHLPDASGGVRARRAEGVLLGAGARYGPDDRTGLALWAGWPFARARPEARLDLELPLGSLDLSASLYANRLVDIGPWRAAPGLLSTLAFAAEGEDWTDPYFQTGGQVEVEAPAAGGRAVVALAFARHDSARLVAGPVGVRGGRPVRPIAVGTAGELRVGFRRPLGRGLGAAWEARLEGRAAVAGVGDFGYARALARLRADGSVGGGPWTWSLEMAGGVAEGSVPPQRLMLLGGRGSVPGHPFRAWGGDRAIWGRAQTARDLFAPWVRVRAHAAAGWATVSTGGLPAAETLGVGASAGIRPSVGLGLGTLWDVLRFDLWRGLGGGDWALLFSVDPAFWEIL